MLFNSYEFILIFLPITLLGYFFLHEFKAAKSAVGFLVVSSLAFYSYWDIKMLPLLLSSIIFNYSMGRVIEKKACKKYLVIGISVNLLLLILFKYLAFIANTVNAFAGTTLPVPEITLPLGISFYTFTQTAYLIDVYRRETTHYSLMKYSLFVTIFPHLIAGPILYHKKMLPQFSDVSKYLFSSKNFALGVSIFSIGLFKKVIIADTLAPWVKVIFDNADKVTFIEAWMGALGYTLQLYFDFSGYSEMAVGLGWMLNFSLPINFRSPYKATSIVDFWRRWHITLSEFLKNYLYISLGGNRKGESRRIINLLITMLLGGLWHGAGWTFVIWGGLHGIYLTINHLWRKTNLAIYPVISWGITFLSVVFAWTFFRANSVGDAFQMIFAMSGMKGVVLPTSLHSKVAFLEQFGVGFEKLYYIPDGFFQIGTILAIFILTICFKEPDLANDFKPNLKWALITSVIFVMSFISLSKASEFLYFQF
nr:MBOAT family O-acyltransferase [uncultured Anaeromusa sp.]